MGAGLKGVALSVGRWIGSGLCARVCLKTPKRRLFCPKTVLSVSKILERLQAFLAVFSLKALVFGQKSGISPVLKQTLASTEVK